MSDLIASYEVFLLNIKRASDNTVSSYMRDVRQFSEYAEQTLQKSISLIDQSDISGYMTYLTEKRKSPADDNSFCCLSEKLL